jgi:hypothetical protein
MVKAGRPCHEKLGITSPTNPPWTEAQHIGTGCWMGVTIRRAHHHAVVMAAIAIDRRSRSIGGAIVI